MNEGYIKLYRKILENPIIMKDTEHLALWIYILLNATHKEMKVIFGNNTKILKPGEFITGLKKISIETNIEIHKVDRILKLFKSEKQIEIQTCTKGRLISVLNWEEYQSNEKQNEKQMRNERETNEKRVRTNKNERMKECKNIYVVVEENLQMTLSPANFEKINFLVEKYGEEKVIEAVNKSANANKRSLSYVEGILKNSNYKIEQPIPSWMNQEIEKEEEYQISDEDRKRFGLDT
jgi:DnaD/phage-associated family protein